MGAAAILGAVGLAARSISSAIGAVQRSQAEVAASKMREAEGKRRAFGEAEKAKQEGDVFLAEQRAIIGKSGVARTGSPLQLLASNAEAVQRDSATFIAEGIHLAKIEEARRESARRSRDSGLMLSLLLPGGSAAGFNVAADIVSGERWSSEATLARRLSQGQFGARGRVLGRAS